MKILVKFSIWFGEVVPICLSDFVLSDSRNISFLYTPPLQFFLLFRKQLAIARTNNVFTSLTSLLAKRISLFFELTLLSAREITERCTLSTTHPAAMSEQVPRNERAETFARPLRRAKPSELCLFQNFSQRTQIQPFKNLCRMVSISGIRKEGNLLASQLSLRPPQNRRLSEPPTSLFGMHVRSGPLLHLFADSHLHTDALTAKGGLGC